MAEKKPREQAGADRKSRRKNGGTTAWEWVAAGVGGLILACVAGFLIHDGLSGTVSGRPDIIARDGPVQVLPSGTFLLPIVVENRGEATGANVRVTGSLLDAAGAVVERSTASFDFVARRGQETGGLYFAADPRSLGFVLRVEGYADP